MKQTLKKLFEDKAAIITLRFFHIKVKSFLSACCQSKFYLSKTISMLDISRTLFVAFSTFQHLGQSQNSIDRHSLPSCSATLPLFPPRIDSCVLLLKRYQFAADDDGVPRHEQHHRQLFNLFLDFQF